MKKLLFISAASLAIGIFLLSAFRHAETLPIVEESGFSNFCQIDMSCRLVWPNFAPIVEPCPVGEHLEPNCAAAAERARDACVNGKYDVLCSVFKTKTDQLIDAAVLASRSCTPGNQACYDAICTQLSRDVNAAADALQDIWIQECTKCQIDYMNALRACCIKDQ